MGICLHWSWPLAAGVALVLATVVPAVAFDDQDFCVAAQQLAAAADGDVGLWLDSDEILARAFLILTDMTTAKAEEEAERQAYLASADYRKWARFDGQQRARLKNSIELTR